MEDNAEGIAPERQQEIVEILAHVCEVSGLSPDEVIRRVRKILREEQESAGVSDPQRVKGGDHTSGIPLPG